MPRARMGRTNQVFFRRLWLVLCEASIAGVFPTARQADAAAARFRAVGKADFTVEGPFLRDTKGVRR